MRVLLCENGFHDGGGDAAAIGGANDGGKVDSTRHPSMEKHVKITVQPILPGRRRNSPRPDTLCADLASLTSLPAALFVADEAAIAIDVDGESRTHVRALIGVGPDDEFAGAIHLIATVPGVGVIERPHMVTMRGTVQEAAE